MKNWKPKCTNSPYQEYGKILKINAFYVAIFVCLITPFTNWLIPLISGLKRFEIGRITIHNKVKE